MMHSKFQGHPLIGSEEEDFFKVFTIYGRRGHIGHVNKTTGTTFHSSHPPKASYEIHL